MTEKSDESPLRPAEDQRIRALLADLGSGPDGESMPPEVAARLDATLARLVAEREAADPEESGSTTRDATVVPLRRRWATRGAAAAAAVIVVAGGGIAAANLGLLGGATTADSSAGGSSSASGAERSLGSGAQDQATPSPGQSSPGQPSPGQASEGSDRLDNGDAVAKGAVPALTAASFRGQVTTLLGDGDAADLSAPSARGRREVTLPLAPSASPSASAPDAGSDPGSDPGGGAGSSPGTATAGPSQVGSCLSPPLTDGARVTAITFDGAPAVLVVHPAVQGRRLVEAWSCGGSQRLAQTRVATAVGAP